MAIRPSDFGYQAVSGRMAKGWTVKQARNRVIERLNASDIEDAVRRRIIQYDLDGDIFVVIRYGSAILQAIKFDEEHNECDAYWCLDNIKECIKNGDLDEEIMSVRRRRYANAA